MFRMKYESIELELDDDLVGLLKKAAGEAGVSENQFVCDIMGGYVRTRMQAELRFAYEALVAARRIDSPTTQDGWRKRYASLLPDAAASLTTDDRETVEYRETVKQDEHGQLYIELPMELLKILGWESGDTLVWEAIGDGDDRLRLSKVID